MRILAAIMDVPAAQRVLTRRGASPMARPLAPAASLEPVVVPRFDGLEALDFYQTTPGDWDVAA
jgi:hypothetical protein